jgi:hypothetical protein
MFDLGSLGVILIFIFLIAIALAIALKLLSMNEDQLRSRQAGPVTQAAAEGNFLESFLKPIYDDGLEQMENAVDSIGNGLDYYDHGAYVNAGEEFIAARHSIDTAYRKFREVMSLVEDRENEYAKKSIARMADCKRFLEMAKDMESASDAMLEDRDADAKAILDRTKDLRKMIDAWKKE